MTHASLFSGIGGPEVAASMLGWTNAFHCEINPFGRAVLEYWYPDSISYDDITKTDFKPWRGQIDVLTGGFPCQPFSYAGKRGGREDDRYLWPEMLRAIDEIRPAWVIGENVAGITTMVEGGVLTDLGGGSTLFDADNEFHGYELEQSFTIERICRDLERLGYSVQPLLIPAAAVGAPHRRDRVFILAFDADTNRNREMRKTGEYEGASRAERLQERDEIRVAGKPNQLRPQVCESAADPASDGLHGGTGEDGKERCAGADPFGTSPQGADGIGLRREPGIYGKQCDAADPLRARCERQDKSWSGQTGERMCLWGDLAGYCGQDNEGRSAADADGRGCKPQDPRVGTPGNGGNDALQGEWGFQAERADGFPAIQWSFAGAGLRPENRWANFPTVSPVHAGNDGLPFWMDGASIPFTKWRTEALKAYGNAIVPQVMYRIFQAIEKI